MSVLSENILALRKRWANQTEFGERIGVTQSTIARWEKGADPKPEHLLVLADAAGVSIELFITTPLNSIPKRGARDPLPNDADFRQMVADALQEVPPGTPLAGYPPIVASSLRDRLVLLLKHGASQGSQAEKNVPDRAVQSRAPTKPPFVAGRRNR